MSKFTESVVRNFHKGVFTLKKFSPEILIAVGICGGVAAAVTACRASIKAHETIVESRDAVDELNDYIERTDSQEDAEQIQADIKTEYHKCAMKVAKAYGPSLAMGIASIGCILTAYNIMHNRGLALAAANAATMQMFNDYRKNVRDELGEEADHRFRYGEKVIEREKEIVDPKTGEKKMVTEKEKVLDIRGSDYARLFDETNPAWVRNAGQNLDFLRSQQCYANDRLRRKGYVFLNEVYSMLGYDETCAGNIVGWVYDPNDDTHGDNWIDFGISSFDKHSSRVDDFINGYEKSVLLDFNVDGDILHNELIFAKI